MNSGGPANLTMNLAVVLVLLLVLSRLARPALSCSDARPIVVFSRWGFVGLSIYLVLLYGVTYIFLRPQGLPSAPVQLLTFIFYALVIASLWLHRRREPMPGTAVQVETRESRLVKILFALILGFGSCIVGLCRNAGPVNPSRGELCDLDTSGVRADGGGPRKRGWGTHDSRTRSSGLKDNQECGKMR